MIDLLILIAAPYSIDHSIDILATNPNPNIRLDQMYLDGAHNITDFMER